MPYLKKNNALISVFDKTNIIGIAQKLKKNDFNIFTTGNTYEFLLKNGIQSEKITNYIDFPEIMNGKIKTLHPKIFGGVLYDYSQDKQVIQDYNLITFNLIIVNFYSFPICKSINNIDIKIIENIDIGGPALVRAASKNYKNVMVITDINDYSIIDHCLKEKNNRVFFDCNEKIQLRLAAKAFKYVYLYDKVIYKYFLKITSEKINISFPENFSVYLKKKMDLRYGENPHQKAALYIEEDVLEKCSIINSKKIQGKELSYNNLLDGNAALECLKEFRELGECTCVIVKHNNPSSIAIRKNILDAYKSAYCNDPISSFGGIIAFNQILDIDTIKYIVKNQFLEMIIVPEISKIACNFLLKNKPMIRVLIVNNLYMKNNNINNQLYEMKQINGGMLIQNVNNVCHTKYVKEWSVVSMKYPSQFEMRDCIFAIKVVKCIQSNAVVYVNNLQTLAIGGGQTSRIDSVNLANQKLNNNKIDKKFNSLVLASDAFFPFKDSIESAFLKGVTCIIQPGGSVRDQEVIQTVNKLGMSMIFTHKRYFRH
ncbi:bifunctional phosphoribosylaminoimidazolecarboxamide formyltransferase/IMP cyclohydrolase [Buchnera aphidicola (Thelaxes californica)]|uniref:Bifunctional purine biosynthesis protein PurH n=1 Tax=Buchnera aphidicola (Thelaxes californica) TaxID=1315998 RepID=A0A4D6Y9B3_9GAMM|nr:bifunctional phosphoribosylaminoimidazolecarboxamide formyltransferase/IMP cyclohydrolase [Buchnera aphidicola]QCI26586.1 bifunctional phosphoribosylaminoimidazolecarboxamide formyltransferase/IMP cyclohydrolase [Buchnera aphidicola (Thelaxes californica)]